MIESLKEIIKTASSVPGMNADKLIKFTEAATTLAKVTRPVTALVVGAVAINGAVKVAVAKEQTTREVAVAKEQTTREVAVAKEQTTREVAVAKEQTTREVAVAKEQTTQQAMKEDTARIVAVEETNRLNLELEQQRWFATLRKWF